jgi:hypothetical protein
MYLRWRLETDLVVVTRPITFDHLTIEMRRSQRAPQSDFYANLVLSFVRTSCVLRFRQRGYQNFNALLEFRCADNS